MSTVSAGGIGTAALWNSQVRDTGNFFLGVPHVILAQGTAQTIATSAFAALLFDVEIRDNDSVHSTVSNTSRITIVTAGWYEVSGTVGWAGNATGQRLSHWAVNGTGADRTEISANATLGTSTGYAACTTSLFLNVGDHLELHIWQNTGGNLNTNVGATTRSRAAARWLGQ